MRNIELIPRAGSHSLVQDGVELARFNILAAAERVREDLVREQVEKAEERFQDWYNQNPLKAEAYLAAGGCAASFEQQADNTKNGDRTVNDTSLRAGYEAQQQQIERLESWVSEAISRPAMPRELRLEGLELVGERRPDVRQAVERICPVQEMGRSLELGIDL